jgi:SAM-dependent methyltransferase
MTTDLPPVTVDYCQFKQRADRAEYIASRFGGYLTGKVLDVGCDKASLKPLLPSAQYLGIDVQGQPDMRLDLEKAEVLPFEDGQFDAVVCSDVLEHLDNLHAMFDELLRVSRRYVVISLPNCWSVARVPIQRGKGAFAHYGLPPDRPVDRHKWFFSLQQAGEFINERIARHPGVRLVAQRINEKRRPACLRILRRLRYPCRARYWNRYAHTIWFVLEK